MKYAKSLPTTALRQGELLANVIEMTINVNTMFTERPDYVRKIHPFAFIVSQDCDLDWDFTSRQNQTQAHKILPNVLLCEAMLANDLARQTMDVEGSKRSDKSRTWAKVKINKDERYHFFEQVNKSEDSENEGILELGVDFKRYFTVPTDELYARIQHKETIRRCRLLSPYMEHFSDRFTYFQSRIALPEEHYSNPEVIKRIQGDSD